MNYCFTEQVDFSDLKSLISKSNCSLTDVLSHRQFRVAFKRQYSLLIVYLSSKLVELIEIALSSCNEDNANIVSNAIFCFTTKAVSFTNHFAVKHAFLRKIFGFLTQDDFSLDRASSFSMIFSKILKFTTGYILVTFPNKDIFIQNLIKHSDKPPILDCISTILLTEFVPVLKFIELNCFVKKIFKEACETNDAERQQNMLGLLCEASRNRICSILSIATTDNVNVLFTLLYNVESKLSKSMIVSLIINICNCLKETNDCNWEFKSIINYLLDKIIEIAKYIQENNDFNSFKSILTDLIVYLIPYKKEHYDTLLDLIFYYFNNLFIFPNTTVLHHHFIILFKLLLQEVPQEKLEIIIKRIPIAFKNDYKIIGASYWYYLYQASQLICYFKKEPCNDENWNEYIQSTYKYISEKSKLSYGKFNISFLESSDSYYYEEDNFSDYD